MSTSWSSKRKALAEAIGSGLAGWFQMNIAQDLHELSGEDSSRFVIAQIINARAQYKVLTGEKPPNWGTTKMRVDLAIAASSANATGWYGAIEAKWPGKAFDVGQVRLAILQDAVRLASIKTQMLNAHYLIVGGLRPAITALFDTPHVNAAAKEAARTAFAACLPRASSQPDVVTTISSLKSHYPTVTDRVPTGLAPTGRLALSLLNHTTAGVATAGDVYVWQCNKRR